jgi:thimet oligopeptidase
MLEEMFHDTAILQSFGKHYQTGETIPASLIAKMNAASAYGRASWLQGSSSTPPTRSRSTIRPPLPSISMRCWPGRRRALQPLHAVDGDRFYASFTHLVGYASNYYTYVLDKVIAIDFFAQFDKRNLLDGPTAMRYRRAVLEPGASKPAAELVKDFLGREQNMDALKTWMNEEFQPSALIANRRLRNRHLLD